MPEGPERWWEETSEVSNQENPEPTESISIRGYQREGDQWVQSEAKDTIAPSSGGASEKTISDFPNYHKQKIASTAFFFVAFSIGDWWWDGSNGFLALINSFESVTRMPGSLIDSYEFWTSGYGGLNAIDAMLITISWMLWDITPLVFFVGFALCWRGWRKDNKTEANRILNGKRSYNFLLYFSVALVSMDILRHVVWSGLVGVIDWPSAFLELHFWQLVAITAVVGLNPDYDLWERFNSLQSAKE